MLRKVGMMDPCSECFGAGEYWTEWGNSAEADPEMKALVLLYPDPPDGTVLIRCSTCGKNQSRNLINRS